MELNRYRTNQLIICLNNPRGIFKKTIFTKINTTSKVEISCQNVIDTIFNLRLKNRFRHMRLHLALSKPMFLEGFRDSEIGNSLKYKINTHIEHPHTSTLLLEFKEITELPPLSEDEGEVQEAMKLYNEFSSTQCKVYKNEYLKNSIDRHKVNYKVTQEKITISLCSEHPYKEIINEKSRYLKEVKKEIIDDYFRWLHERRKEMREDYLQLYYDAINHSPYFIYMPSANPTTDQLIYAMEQIQQNNLERIQKMDKYRSENMINKRIISFRKAHLATHELVDLKNDLLYYYKDATLTGFSELNQNLASDEDYELRESLYLELNKEVEKQEQEQFIKHAGLLVAVVASCFTPMGRVYQKIKVSYRLKKLPSTRQFKKRSRALCFLALGVPLNSYFLYDSIETMKENFSNFSSSPDGVYMIQGFDSLNESHKMIVLNTLFIGLGLASFL